MRLFFSITLLLISGCTKTDPTYELPQGVISSAKEVCKNNGDVSHIEVTSKEDFFAFVTCGKQGLLGINADGSRFNVLAKPAKMVRFSKEQINQCEIKCDKKVELLTETNCLCK